MELAEPEEDLEEFQPKGKVARIFLPLLQPCRYKGAYGGRGSGKSHFFAQLLVIKTYSEHTRAVGLREIQNSIEQSSKLLIVDKINAMGLRNEFDVREKTIIGPNESIITFQGMQNKTAESARGLEGYGIAWFDEAHRCSAQSLSLLRPTIRAPNSELWFSWNPQSPNDPIDKFLRRELPESDRILVEANYDDNPLFPDELRAEMLHDRRRDIERYKHVWLGEYQQHSEARVFHNFRIEDFETPEDIIFYHGCDWGFAKDPTVLIRCFFIGRNLYVDREVWKVGCEIDNTPTLFDELDPENIGYARKWRIVADSSDPQIISYMRRAGYEKIQPAIKGPKSVEEGVEFLKSYDIIVHPRCKHVWDELMHYSYEVDKRTEQVLPKLADKKNHTIDALRYAVEAIRRKPIPGGIASY